MNSLDDELVNFLLKLRIFSFSLPFLFSFNQVGDEILAVNLVDVTHMSLDDVVIIMSIPRRLVLATRRGQHQPVSHSRQAEHKAPPVVVIKRDLNEDESDHATSNHVR